MTSKMISFPMVLKIKHFRFSAALTIVFALLASPSSFSQGMLVAQSGITAADISALRGATAGGSGLGAAGLGGGATGVTGFLAIPMPTVGAEDDADTAKPDSKNNKKQVPYRLMSFKNIFCKPLGRCYPYLAQTSLKT